MMSSFIANANIFVFYSAFLSSDASVRAQSVPGYAYVGIGRCYDLIGNSYDFYSKTPVSSTTDCGSACLGISGLLGFDLDTSVGTCYCRVENGVVTASSLPSGFSSFDDSSGGSGSIVRAVGPPSMNCYKVDNVSMK